MHADPRRPVFKSKTLLYLEQSLAGWLMDGGALPLLLPPAAGAFTPDEILADMDALVLQGGSDVAPPSYGEQPLRPEWSGDAVRDEYETALIHVALARGLPTLGICRGLQILNVALGGSLFQDIATQQAGAQVHRDYEQYDALMHDIRFEPGSLLQSAYGREGGRVNTVHHQAIDRLAHGLRAEARSVPDGVIEAVRYHARASTGVAPFVYGVQWHPEFQDPADTSLLPTAPLRDLFLDAVRRSGAASR